MTREEAIEYITSVREFYRTMEKFAETKDEAKFGIALDMAIESLQGGDAEMNEINPKQYMQVSPSNGADLISRADAIGAVAGLVASEYVVKDGEHGFYTCASVAQNVLSALPSADAVQLKQTDTLIIADALRYLAEDTERHPSDRARAEILRGQILAYGAKMSADAVHESCEDCPLYDKERHNCPRFNKVIPRTIAEAVQGWIPVSERLPKEKQEVYVTVYFIEGDTGRAYGYMDGFGKWHLCSTVEGTLNSGYEVIAWMPLPMPYREDGEDE